MRRIWAILIHASAEAMDFSQSFASLRHRPSHAEAQRREIDGPVERDGLIAPRERRAAAKVLLKPPTQRLGVAVEDDRGISARVGIEGQIAGVAIVPANPDLTSSARRNSAAWAGDVVSGRS